MSELELVFTQPWLAKQMASRGEGPGDLVERAKIVLLLSHLDFKAQQLSLSGCYERDKLFEYLLLQEEYGSLLKLLHSDLGRWLPEVSEYDDLPWLIEKLLQTMQLSAGKKTKLIMQTPAGRKEWLSASALAAYQTDAIESAAGAWVRCLGGVGGVSRALAISLPHLDLALAVSELLSRDPRALALLLESATLEADFSWLPKSEYNHLLQRGAGAAALCRDLIFEALSMPSEL